MKDEARRLEEEGALVYPLHARPRLASRRCWVYFVRDGYLVGRAMAADFYKEDKETYSYGGKTMEGGKWIVKCVPPLQIAIRRISHSGFQGFRYVTPEDRFETAFE